MTTSLKGKPAADCVRDGVKSRVDERRQKAGSVPGLAVVLVGRDPASEIYVAKKHKAAVAVGMHSFECRLDANSGTGAVLDVVSQLNRNPDVHGILVQLPLPDGVDSDAVIQHIDAAKDVDGLGRLSQGALVQNRPGLRPCTAVGIIDLLDYYEVPLEGRQAVVVGRSSLVGLPTALLLMHRNATVSVIHSKTPSPARIARTADILVVAAGRPGLVTREWIKPNAVVVDVGIHRTDSGIVGDVLADEAWGHASAFTPVPGGVGPMTIAELLHNTWMAFQTQVVAG